MAYKRFNIFFIYNRGRIKLFYISRYNILPKQDITKNSPKGLFLVWECDTIEVWKESAK